MITTPRYPVLTAACFLWAGLAFGPRSAQAQYPNISSEIKAESDARKAASDQRSDEAWEKALPTVKEWEAKGKPYLPGAGAPADLPSAPIPSFPGALGGGMYSFGGRGGKVIVVTSLEDHGPGTFREACEAGGPRIVVFNVAGIIKLKERIRVRAPYITIAGNTAPGSGVCIAGNTVELEIARHHRPAHALSAGSDLASATATTPSAATPSAT